MGSVYKEIGEPGKEETSKKKVGDIPYEEMPIEKLGGAVIYAKNDDDIYVALVHDVFGHWTLSKGGLEESEDVKKGIIRKKEKSENKLYISWQKLHLRNSISLLQAGLMMHDGSSSLRS